MKLILWTITAFLLITAMSTTVAYISTEENSVSLTAPFGLDQLLIREKRGLFKSIKKRFKKLGKSVEKRGKSVIDGTLANVG